MAKKTFAPYRAFTPQQEALITQQTEIIVKETITRLMVVGGKLLVDDFGMTAEQRDEWTRRTMFYASPANVGKEYQPVNA